MAQGRIKLGIDIVKGDVSGLVALRHDLESLKGITEKDLIKLNVSDAQGELRKISQEVAAVEAALEKSFNKKLNTNSISTFNKELQKSGYTLQGLVGHWNTLDAKSKQASISLTSMLMTQNKHLKESSQLLDKMSETMSNTIRWTIASSALNAMTGAVQKAYSFTKQLDNSLNDIMIVTGKSSDEMARFAQQANKAAKSLGAVTTDYTKAALIYYQQGLSEAEVQARSETTVKVANITGQSADAVSQQLTAVWNGYKVSAQESEAYIDKLAKVAARTAADLEELSTGMSKVASAANIMGVDIDQLNAQLATIVSVTREAPESIGTALKTVYARMSDIESGLDAETTLGEYTKQMKAFGINAIDAQGNLRDMGTVVEEIGNKWDTLNRSQQAALAQVIAGTRQYSRMMALFDNWDMYQAAKGDSQNAMGTVQTQNEIYLESLEAHFNSLQAEAENLYQTLFNADDLKPLVEGLTKLVDLTDNLVGGLGGGDGLLGVLTSIGMTVFGDKLAGGMARMTRNVQGFITSFDDAKVMKQLTSQMSTKTGIDDEDALQRIVAIKQKQLKIERFLTVEQQKQADALLQTVASEEQDKIALQEKLTKAKKVRDAIVEPGGDLENTRRDIAVNAKDTSTLAAELAKNEKAYVHATQALKTQQKKYQDHLNSIPQVTSNNKKHLEKKRVQAIASLQSSAQVAQDKGQEKEAAAINAEIAKVKAMDVKSQEFKDWINDYLVRTDSTAQTINEYVIKYKTRVEELEATQRTTMQTAIDDGVLDFQALIKQIDTLNAKDADLVSEEDAQELEKIKKHFNELATAMAKNNGQFTFTDNISLENLITDFQKFSRISGISDEKLKEFINTLNTGEKELGDIERRLKAAEKAAEDFAESFNMERVMGSITDVTSGVVSLFSAIEQLHNLGDIWSNEDISTGEKLFRTIVSLAAATGLAVNSFKQLKEGWVAASDMFSKYITKKIKEEAASGAANMASAATEKIKAAATRDSADATRESTNAQREENAEEKNTQSNNVKSAFTEKFSKVKDTTKGNWGKFFGKAGGGSFLKAAGGAAAVVGAIAVVALSAYAAFKLVESSEQKLEKAYKEAEEQASALRDRLSEVESQAQELDASISNLSSLQDELQGLTVGTVEWQKALTEVNAEVLQLLKTYPELAQYLKTDANGVMTISDAGLMVAQEKQLEELRAARTAVYAAEMHAEDKRIAYLREQSFEQLAGSGNQAAHAAATTGAVAGIGAGIGAFGGPVGMLIGAAIGAAAGGLVSLVNYGIQENKEDKFESYLSGDTINALVDAYQKNGEVILSSSTALAEALNKDVTALSANERALLENKAATLELVAAMAAKQATERATMLEMGASIVGDEATTGEKLTAADFYNTQYELELEALTRRSDSTENYAREALSRMGLDPNASLISAKDKQNITYRDKEGNEQSMSLSTAIATIAQDNAKKSSNANADRIVQGFEKALSHFASTEVKNLVSEIGLTGFNLQTASYSAFGEMSNLTPEQIQVIAKAQGKSYEEVQLALTNAVNQAAKDWEAPAGLEGEVLAKFKYMVNNISLDTVTLDAYNKFASSFDTIWERFGETGVDTVYTMLANAGDKSDELLNEIGSIDWSAEDSTKRLSEALLQLEVSIDPTVFSDFISIMHHVNGLYGESAEALSNMITSFKKMTADLTTGSIVTKETYEALSETVGGANIDKFFIKLSENEYMLRTSGTILQEAGLSLLDQRVTNSAKEKFDRSAHILELLKTYDKDVGEANAINTNSYTFTDEERAAAKGIVKKHEDYDPNAYYSDGSTRGNGLWSDRDGWKAYNKSNSFSNIVDAIEAAGTMTEEDIATLRKYMVDDTIDPKKMRDDKVSLFGKAIDDSSYDERLYSSGGGYIENSAIAEINRAYTEAQWLLGERNSAGDFTSWLNDDEKAFIGQDKERKERVAQEKEDNETKKAELLKPYEGKTKDEFLAEQEVLRKELIETGNVALQQSRSYAELTATVKLFQDYGIDYTTKELSSEYIDNIERLGIQTYQTIADEAVLSTVALKDYVEQVAKSMELDLSSPEQLLQAYQAAFQALVAGTEQWDAALTEANKTLSSLEKQGEKLEGGKALQNLVKQKAELEKIKQEIVGRDETTITTTDDEGNTTTTKLSAYTGKKDFVQQSYKQKISGELAGLSTTLGEAGFTFTNSKGEAINGEAMLASLFDSKTGEINQAAVADLRSLYAQNLPYFLENAEIKDQFDAVLNFLNEYDTEYSNLLQEEEDTERRILETNLAILNQKLEMKREELEIQRTINDLSLELADEDDFAARAAIIGAGVSVQTTAQGVSTASTENSKSEIAQVMERIKENNASLAELETAWENKDLEDSDYFQQKEALLQDNISSMKELNSLYKELEDLEKSALDEVNSRYDKQTSMRDAIVDTLEQEYQIQELLNKEKANKNYTAILEQQTAKVNDVTAEAAYWKSLMDASDFANREQEYKDLVVSNYQQAMSEIGDYTSEVIETRREQYLDMQQDVLDAFEQQLLQTDSLFERTLSGVQEEWDWTQGMDDKYLDTIEEAFADKELQRLFDKAVNATTNSKAIAAINKVRDKQIADLEKIDKLTQRDYDRAEAKLKLLEAEIALEDARDSKTQMRLMRSANGSYSYQYVANTDDVMEKEAALSEAQQALYTHDKEAYQENINEFSSVYKTYTDYMTTAAEDGELTGEEMAMIAQYRDQLALIAEENVFLSAQFTDTAETLGVSVDELLTNTSNGAQDMITAFREYAEEYAKAGENLEAQSQTTLGALEKQLQENATNFRNTVKDDMEAVTGYCDESNKAVAGSAETLIASYDSIIDQLAGDGEDNPGLIKLAENQAKAITDEVVALENVSAAYDALGVSIDSIAASYRALATAKELANRTVSESSVTPTGADATGLGGVGVTVADNSSNSILKNLGSAGGGQEEPTTPQVYSIGTSKYTASGFNSVVGGDFDNDVVFTIKYTDENGKEHNFKSNQSAIFDKSTTTEYYNSNFQSKGFEGYTSDKDGNKTTTKIGTIYDKNSEIFQQLTLGITGKADVYPAAGTIAVMNDIPYYFQYDKKGNPRWAIIWDESTEEGGNLGTYQKGLVDAIKAASMDTGGYTGEWGSEGKFLMAHEKELILNKTDTRNILDAVDIVRSLNTSMLKTTSGLGSGYDLSMAAWELAKDFIIEQTVHINAEFPNATNSSEIQEAFEELILLATQHAFEDVKGR